MNVVNSVQQIKAECEELIKCAEEYPNFYDVKMHAIQTRNAVQDLEKTFNDDPGNTIKLNKFKYVAEDAGLQLEYFLVVRCHRYTERYERRIEANRLYTELRSFVYDCKTKDNTKLLEYYDNLDWALKFCARSKHLLFVVEDEDQSKLNTIYSILEENK